MSWGDAVGSGDSGLEWRAPTVKDALQGVATVGRGGRIAIRPYKPDQYPSTENWHLVSADWSDRSATEGGRYVVRRWQLGVGFEKGRIAMHRKGWHERPNCNSALPDPTNVHQLITGTWILATENCRLPTGNSLPLHNSVATHRNVTAWSWLGIGSRRHRCISAHLNDGMIWPEVAWLRGFWEMGETGDSRPNPFVPIFAVVTFRYM